MWWLQAVDSINLEIPSLPHRAFTLALWHMTLSVSLYWKCEVFTPHFIDADLMTHFFFDVCLVEDLNDLSPAVWIYWGDRFFARSLREPLDPSPSGQESVPSMFKWTFSNDLVRYYVFDWERVFKSCKKDKAHMSNQSSCHWAPLAYLHSYIIYLTSNHMKHSLSSF